MGNPWKCSRKCSRGCTGKSGCSGGCSRECSGKLGVLQGVFPTSALPVDASHRKSTLGSTPWSTPISLSTLGSTPRSTPISRREHFREHFQGFSHFSTPVTGGWGCNVTSEDSWALSLPISVVQHHVLSD